jgi:predicted extracellular nuclease
MNTKSWQPPAIIGVCEIENRKVLEDLTTETSMVKYGYHIVHQESPDERGIDVALLYRKDYVEMIGSKTYEVRLPHDTADRTRDILMATGVIGDDTLHFFVNHWPSRYGGVQKSQPNRITAARVLRGAVDSLFAVNPNKKIIIMGDFNDGPENKSISEVLGAMGSLDTLPSQGALYNFMYRLSKQGLGTHRYQGTWNALDQFIGSSSVIHGRKFTAMPESVHIMKEEFLLEEDKYNPGNKPFRTFVGPRYIGGYSDHLPIVMTLSYK